jgi:L-cysteine S-thiosulfotransferase
MSLPRPRPTRARLAIVAFCGSCFAAQAQDAAQGRELFMRKDKGNCIACHEVPSDPAIATRATVGPALSGIRDRLPDRSAVREILLDPARRNPATLMPPYGRHRILVDAEIEHLVDYLHALR